MLTNIYGVNEYPTQENENMTITLTNPVQDAIYLTPASRMTCREAITKVSLALAKYYSVRPDIRDLPSGLLAELEKVMDAI